MEDKELKELADKMDLNRTDKLFNATIKSADIFAGKKFTDESIKAARVVAGMGNLHVATAKTKLSAARMIGYRNAVEALKKNISRKVRRSVRRKAE